MRGSWPGQPVIPVDETVHDDGHLQLRREHSVRDAGLGTIQKQRLSHDKSPRERERQIWLFNGYFKIN